MSIRTFLSTVGLCALTLTLPALASESAPHAAEVSAPVPVFEQEAAHLRFDAYMGGLHVAVLSVSTERHDGVMAASMDVKGRGLADLLMGLDVTARNEARLAGSQGFTPLSYSYDYKSYRHSRKVAVDYHFDDGSASPQIRTKGSPLVKDQWRESRVPEDQRGGALDPISTFLRAMAVARDHVENGGPKQVVVPVYDGPRRYDLEITFQGQGVRRIWGKNFDAYQVLLQAKPVAGFKSRHAKEWRESPYHLYLSTDGRYLPIQLGAIKNGPIIHLSRVCDTAAACSAHRED